MQHFLRALSQPTTSSWPLTVGLAEFPPRIWVKKSWARVAEPWQNWQHHVILWQNITQGLIPHQHSNPNSSRTQGEGHYQGPREEHPPRTNPKDFRPISPCELVEFTKQFTHLTVCGIFSLLPGHCGHLRWLGIGWGYTLCIRAPIRTNLWETNWKGALATKIPASEKGVVLMSDRGLGEPGNSFLSSILWYFWTSKNFVGDYTCLNSAIYRMPLEGF